MAYPSLIKFCIAELGYSEGAAWRRVNASRLMRDNDSVAIKIEDGTLSLTNAAKVQSVVQQAKREHVGLPTEQLIEKVSQLSTREAEKVIATTAAEFGFEAPAQDSLEEKLQALRAYFSHKNPNPSHHELMHLMADEILGKKGDLTAKVKSPDKRHVPRKLRLAIFARDQHRCTFTENARRCEGTHFLQVDHIQPFAIGRERARQPSHSLRHAQPLPQRAFSAEAG